MQVERTRLACMRNPFELRISNLARKVNLGFLLMFSDLSYPHEAARSSLKTLTLSIRSSQRNQSWRGHIDMSTAKRLHGAKCKNLMHYFNVYTLSNHDYLDRLNLDQSDRDSFSLTTLKKWMRFYIWFMIYDRSSKLEHRVTPISVWVPSVEMAR